MVNAHSSHSTHSHTKINMYTIYWALLKHISSLIFTQRKKSCRYIILYRTGRLPSLTVYNLYYTYIHTLSIYIKRISWYSSENVVDISPPSRLFLVYIYFPRDVYTSISYFVIIKITVYILDCDNHTYFSMERYVGHFDTTAGITYLSRTFWVGILSACAIWWFSCLFMKTQTCNDIRRG